MINLIYLLLIDCEYTDRVKDNDQKKQQILCKLEKIRLKGLVETSLEEIGGKFFLKY